MLFLFILLILEYVEKVFVLNCLYKYLQDKRNADFDCCLKRAWFHIFIFPNNIHPNVNHLFNSMKFILIMMSIDDHWVDKSYFSSFLKLLIRKYQKWYQKSVWQKNQHFKSDWLSYRLLLVRLFRKTFDMGFR